MATKSWWIFLLVACLLSAVSAEGEGESRDYRDVYEYDEDEDGEEKCPEINLPSGLVGRCEVSDFCSNITCQVKAMNKRAIIIFKINRCEDPITATVTIRLHGYAADWSHTFKDGEVIELPTDSQSDGGFGGMAQVSVSLKVGLKKEGKKLHFKLELLGKTEVSVFHKLDRPIDATLLDGKISLSTKNCGFSAWFNKQPRYMKALLIAGPILVFIILLMLIACCCTRCRRRAPARLHVQLPSHRVQISATRSRVPMQRLINEE
ncbi:hypothetical protein ACROYT_G029607 [Oculina patagonica]